MQENILVCLSNPNNAKALLQRGKTLATAFNGKCIALHVEQKSYNEFDFNQLQTHFFFQSLADQLGIILLNEYSRQNITDTIVETTQSQYVTQIVLGQAVQNRLELVIKDSLINTLFKKLNNVDIHLVHVERDSPLMNSQHRGIPAHLEKEDNEYFLTFNSHNPNAINGIYFKDDSTDFENGFFVLTNSYEFRVARVHNGVASIENSMFVIDHFN
ncbi:histidine kinase [Halalkalibacter alkalisediminis]|uniref:Histidine kinase n=1 Tax=Halalkalibacter alkalisediminis TaxID=935616 RepID=A0ABV6NM97_9BACI|nr:histidine kinase [Halalkalibacter alkalisediminis]